MQLINKKNKISLFFPTSPMVLPQFLDFGQQSLFWGWCTVVLDYNEGWSTQIREPMKWVVKYQYILTSHLNQKIYGIRFMNHITYEVFYSPLLNQCETTTHTWVRNNFLAPSSASHHHIIMTPGYRSRSHLYRYSLHACIKGICRLTTLL